MNAASKGHLPIVHYLLARHTPNPFIRNAYQETAYDVAVATFELGIADILANYESRLWNDHQAHFTSHQSTSTHASTSRMPKPYNPLGMHITVPIVFYENQRLDLRWFSRTKRTLTNPISNSSNASHPSRPPSSIKFTSAALSRRDGHASSELPPSYDGINPTGRWIPLRRNDLALPTILNTRQIQLPPMHLSRNGRPPLQRSTSSNRSQRSFTSPRTPETVEPSTPTMLPPEAEPAWFWLSSKTFIDLSPANIDPEQGWQYATSFDVQEDEWKAEMPEQVARLLAGAVDAQESREAKNVKWVRRRRWARIMRRRIDIPHWGFDDDPEDILYQDHNALGDEETRHVDGEEDDVELAPMRDYLERAQYYAGSHIKHSPHSQQQGSQNLDESDASPSLSAKDDDDTMSLRSYNTVIAGPQAEEEMDRGSGRKITARLERALQELHEGIEGLFSPSDDACRGVHF